MEPFIVERVLNHTLQGVMGIYNRAEYESERMEAAEKLQAAILQVVRPAPDNVTAIQR